MGAFVQELFHLGIYKRSQGRMARQVTFLALVVMTSLGVWRLSQFWPGEPAIQFGVLGVVLFGGVWVCYRVVNFPGFADFLISVEAEMNEVSWPSRLELFRSSLVVMFTIFFLATILFLYDLMWKKLLELLHVLS